MRALTLLLLPSLSLAQARSERTIPIRKEPPAESPTLALPPSYTTVPRALDLFVVNVIPLNDLSRWRCTESGQCSSLSSPDTVLLARPWWPTAVALAAIGGTALWQSSRARTVVDPDHLVAVEG